MDEEHSSHLVSSANKQFLQSSTSQFTHFFSIECYISPSGHDPKHLVLFAVKTLDDKQVRHLSSSISEQILQSSTSQFKHLFSVKCCVSPFGHDAKH